MKRFFAFFLLMLFCSLTAQIKISGTVKFRGKPVKDVNITLKDTYDGATTNEEGIFSFATTEKGAHTLVYTHSKYVAVEKNINITDQEIVSDAELKEQISEIEAVVITAGAIEASDKKRATALLTPIDIYTTAGADGQITTALNYLPGAQTVGESEGLFIRGGTGTETKIFMDGSLINNYFSNSIPGIAGRDRFNPSLFKGNIFSSGGYSAIYGQALSGALILESVDLPEQSSYDIGISPIFLNGGFQRLNASKNTSFGASAGYSMLGLMHKIFDFNTNFTNSPQGFGGDANFRIKTKSGAMIKYYGNLDTNSMAVKSTSLEPGYDANGIALKGNTTYHNLSYRQKIGRYTVNAGTSYSFNLSKLNFSVFNQNNEIPVNFVNSTGNYFNAKAMVERKVNKISAVRAGFEFNNAHENTELQSFSKKYNDLISAVFAETDLGISNDFSLKIGGRAEHSSYMDKSNFAPRVAMAYKFSKNLIGSLAYGMFYQTPESRYLNSINDLDFQKASHYIFQLQHNSEGRNLRLEAFYKDYGHLIKTGGFQFAPQQEFQTAYSNGGNGFAKGIELFWRDKKTLKNIDYWVTYSYLDSKRNFMNYPISLKPNFASEHTISVVGKKFFPKLKSGFNMSYTYAKGRPYYDIVSQGNTSFVRHEGQLKDYSSMNLSLNYLPNLGKTDAKAFTVLVLSVSNVLGRKNIYGYEFSADGSRSAAVLPPVNTFVFVGAFINFGVDRTQDAINTHL